MDKKTLGVAALAFIAGAALVFVITRIPGPWGPLVPETGTDQAPADEGDAAKDPVVATVDGRRIRLSDLEAFKELMPQQYRSLPTQMIFAPLVEQAITAHLLVGAGRKAGLQANPDVRERLGFIEDRLVQNAYLTRLTEEARQKNATDKELDKRYKIFLAGLEAQEEIHARHILLKSKEDAQAAIETLDGGADFAELAKNQSTGPSKDRGGDLGWFAKDAMVPEFAGPAFKLEKGKYTAEPVQTQFGWHVIKVEDRRQKPPPTLDEVKGNLVEEITREYILAKLDRLKAEVRIERFNADGTPIAEKKDGAGAETEGDEQKPAAAETGAKPAGEKPAGEKPAGEMPAGEKPAGEKPAGEKKE